MRNFRIRSVAACLAASLMVGALAPLTALAQDQRPLEVKYSLSYPDGSALKGRPTEVRIVKAEHMQRNVAGKVALGVLLFVVGGGTGFSSSSKDNMKGADIDALEDRNNIKIPDPDVVAERLQALVGTAIVENPEFSGKSFKKSLTIAGGMSNLVYESLTGDEATLYRLKTDWVVYKHKESFSFLTIPMVVVDCAQQSEKALPQAVWAENNYALVKAEMDASIAACENKVLLALPDLLKS